MQNNNLYHQFRYVECERTNHEEQPSVSGAVCPSTAKIPYQQDQDGAFPHNREQTFIELDYGKIYRKVLYLMAKTMVSCRFSLKPIQWNMISITLPHSFNWTALKPFRWCPGPRRLASYRRSAGEAARAGAPPKACAASKKVDDLKTTFRKTGFCDEMGHQFNDQSIYVDYVV